MYALRQNRDGRMLHARATQSRPGREPCCAAIVVCAHKIYASLAQCVAGLAMEVERPEDLVFVANGQADHVGDWVRDRFPRITVLGLPENVHFCGGYNAGIRWALERDYEYFLMANADTEVTAPGFLRRLVAIADGHAQAAFLGPTVFFRSPHEVQKTTLSYPSLWRHLWGWPVHRLHGEGPQILALREVEFLNSVCVLCRSAAVRQIGLLDEVMGGYVEDADWSWRARRAGWTSLYVPEPSVIHHEEPQGYEQYSLKTYMLKRNSVYWLRKKGAHLDAWGYAALSLALAAARAAWATVAGRRSARTAGSAHGWRVYWGLIAGRAIGPWFGPPVGPW